MAYFATFLERLQKAHRGALAEGTLRSPVEWVLPPHPPGAPLGEGMILRALLDPPGEAGYPQLGGPVRHEAEGRRLHLQENRSGGGKISSIVGTTPSGTGIGLGQNRQGTGLPVEGLG